MRRYGGGILKGYVRWFEPVRRRGKRLDPVCAGEEMLSVLPGESVSCDKAVKCRLCESRELNFGFVVAWGVRQRVGAQRRICVRWLESGVLSPVRGVQPGLLSAVRYASDVRVLGATVPLIS